MSRLLQFLGVLAEILTRVLSHLDQKKQDQINEQIEKDPVASFEHRFGELQPDPSDNDKLPGATTKSDEAKSPSAGSGDTHHRT